MNSVIAEVVYCGAPLQQVTIFGLTELETQRLVVFGDDFHRRTVLNAQLYQLHWQREAGILDRSALEVAIQRVRKKDSSF